MAKRKKADLLDYFRIANSYYSVPSSFEEQLELVKRGCPGGYIRKGGGVRIDEASEEQIYGVAENLVESAYKKINNLPAERLNVLKQADRANKTKDEFDIERLCIMAEGVCDEELSDVVDRVVKNFNDNKRFLN